MTVTVNPSVPRGVCKHINISWSTTTGGVNGMGVTRIDNNGNSSSALAPIASSTNPWSDTTMQCGVAYKYAVTLYNGASPVDHGTSTYSVAASCCTRSSGGALIQREDGTYELLAPRDDVINDYTHETNVIDPSPWQHTNTLPLSQSNASIGFQARAAAGTQIKATAVTLIQSTSGNLAAVARVMPPPEGSPYLVGYELDSSGNWQGPVILLADDGPIDNVTGPVSLIEADYQEQHRFELLVPRGAVIDHYILEQGTILQGIWSHVHTLMAPQKAQITSVSFIQSSTGNLEAIARVTPSPSFLGNSSAYLAGYELTSSGEWDGPFPLLTDGNLINNVTGAPALMESDNDVQNRFELMVPRGAVVDHYRHDRETIKGSWRYVDTLRLPANDNRQFTAVWLIQDTSGHLEAGARVKPANANGNLLGYEFDPATGWKGPVPLIANDGPIVANEPPPPKQVGPGCEPRTALTLLALALLVRVILRIFNRKR